MTRSLLAVPVLMILFACGSTSKKQGGPLPLHPFQVTLDGNWHWQPSGDPSKNMTTPVPPSYLVVDGVHAKNMPGYQLNEAHVWLQPGTLTDLNWDDLKAGEAKDAKKDVVHIELPVDSKSTYCRLVMILRGFDSNMDPYEEAFGYEWQVPQYVTSSAAPYPRIPYFRLY